MRTIIPYRYLEKDSWAEDFTASPRQRHNYMYIQCMGHYKARPGYGIFDRKSLHSYLFLYTVQGRGVIRYAGKEITLLPGHGIILDCLVPHSYYCAPNSLWDLRWMHFCGTCLSGYLSEFMDNIDAVAIENGVGILQAIYEKVKTEEQIGMIECSTLLIDLCSQMLTTLMKSHDLRGNEISPIIRNAIEIFEEEFAGSLPLDALCNRLNVSKFYFCRTFKQQIGMSPNEFLIAERLSHAKGLLRSTQLPIADIAGRSGFSTSTYFIRTFKKQEGMTPLHYRKYFLQAAQDEY